MGKGGSQQAGMGGAMPGMGANALQSGFGGAGLPTDLSGLGKKK
jgi:hypothetical protein